MAISKKFKEMFANAETLEELKRVYFEGMEKYVGAKSRVELGSLYLKYFDEVKTWNKNHKTGELYEKSTDELAGEFPLAINTILAIEGVKVERVGSWYWIYDKAGFEGVTKENRETIKEVGGRFAPNKQKWYIAPKNAKRSRKHYTYEEIIAMHGAEELEAEA